MSQKWDDGCYEYKATVQDYHQNEKSEAMRIKMIGVGFLVLVNRFFIALAVL